MGKTDGSRPCSVILKEYNRFNEELRKSAFKCLSQAIFKFPLSREKLALVPF